ncbi:thioredoxin-like protein [Pholiota conissans]|uniref:thioredoxin-dependent peroxiredoxin n=1 Tax=Pholiota conissans TaxID=109636 RepID=A0A9P5Z132_9AGAR|nr:thioredoxin-like protein [Pholiota conissans]
MTYQTLIGKTAPAITLKNYDGESFTFTPGEKGVPTVLFFYPESGSYGCTKEACQFRDAIATKDTFKTGSVQIIGISPDSVEKQKKFVEKEKLTYPVLSDTTKETFKAYSIGRGILGLLPVARVTFVVDKEGIVRDALDATINYGAHSKFVEKWLTKLEAEEKAAKEPAPAATEVAEATPAATAEAPAEAAPAEVAPAAAATA